MIRPIQTLNQTEHFANWLRNCIIVYYSFINHFMILIAEARRCRNALYLKNVRWWWDSIDADNGKYLIDNFAITISRCENAINSLTCCENVINYLTWIHLFNLSFRQSASPRLWFAVVATLLILVSVELSFAFAQPAWKLTNFRKLVFFCSRRYCVVTEFRKIKEANVPSFFNVFFPFFNPRAHYNAIDAAN